MQKIFAKTQFLSKKILKDKKILDEKNLKPLLEASWQQYKRGQCVSAQDVLKKYA